MGRAVIIGAGAAGGACAITLAQAGHEVTIIESKAFPRAKVCGEFISPAATSVLESLISAADLRELGARRVDTLVLEVGEREARWEMPTPAWTLSRRALDDELLSRARRLGVRVLQPARAESLDLTSDVARVRVAADGAPGAGAALEADLVVHADGSGRLDPAGAARVRRGVVALKCHVRTPEPVQGVVMRAGSGAYLGRVQVEGTLATCALVAAADLVARHRVRGDADASHDGLLRTLWPAAAGVRREGPWMSCGVPGAALCRPSHPRSIRIGNAAAGVEPVGGEGIGLALWSGARLATLLPTGAWSESDLRLASGLLAREYRARLRWRRPACRLAAEALCRPAIVRAVWPLLAFPPALLAPWYALTGKPLRG